MFENIINFIKKIGKKQEGSKDAAKERLQLVLMQDRANVSADYLDLMKQEIIEVIKKYIDIDEKALEVELTKPKNKDGTFGAPSLYANIPILSIKSNRQESSDLKASQQQNNKGPKNSTVKTEQKPSDKNNKNESKPNQNKPKEAKDKQEVKTVSKTDNKSKETKKVDNKSEETKKIDNNENITKNQKQNQNIKNNNSVNNQKAKSSNSNPKSANNTKKNSTKNKNKK